MNTLTIISNRYFDHILGDYNEAPEIEEAMLDPKYWVIVEGFSNIFSVLNMMFPRLPQGAKLFHGTDKSNIKDITPKNADDVEDIIKGKYCGEFRLVIAPAGGVIAWVVAVVIAAVAAVYLTNRAVIPSSLSKQQQAAGSSNNELSARVNSPRPLGRIPDIYGQLWATPDLITSFTQYIGNVEVEDCLMCLGVGDYEITKVNDGQTPLETISGAIACAYKPNTNIDDYPSYSLGLPAGQKFPDSPMGATRSNSVNGQTLNDPNGAIFRGSNDVVFKYPNQVILPRQASSIANATDLVLIDNATMYTTEAFNSQMSLYSTKAVSVPYVDDTQLETLENTHTLILGTCIIMNNAGWSGYADLAGTYSVSSAVKTNFGTETNPNWRIIITFTAPELVRAEWSWFGGGTYYIAQASVAYTVYKDILLNLDGAYYVQSVSDNSMFLVDPVSVNPNWNDLLDLGGQQTPGISPQIYKSGTSYYTGWFVLKNRQVNMLSVNLNAPNGLYAKDAKNRIVGIFVNVLVEIQQIDDSDNPIGGVYQYVQTLAGAQESMLGWSFRYTLPVIGYWRVRMSRLSAGFLWWSDANIVMAMQEVKWKDLFALYNLSSLTFGDVTMVRTRTWATTGALAVKERKLSMLVTRKLPRRISGSEFTTELFPTKYAADIISHVCLGHIGKLSPDQVDFDNIYNTCSDIVDYFGIADACEFCYTFDSKTLTLEETLGTIARAIFCLAYRQGRVIRISFEKQNGIASMLLNHRNKIPKTEKRTISFGQNKDHDGIEYSYVSPKDDAVLSLYIPQDQSALNPQKIESIGVRSEKQASLHAWREYMKLQYQYLSLETEATQEATALLIGDKILCADNTRTGTQDGEIVGVNDLILFTSQPIALSELIDPYVHLQYTDGTVEAIPIENGPVDQSILLTRPPRQPLIFSPGYFARTVYKITSGEDIEANVDEFLITAISSNTGFRCQLQATNYDDRFYSHDGDYRGT